MCAFEMGYVHMGPDKFEAMLRRKNDKFEQLVAKYKEK